MTCSVWLSCYKPVPEDIRGWCVKNNFGSFMVACVWNFGLFPILKREVLD